MSIKALSHRDRMEICLSGGKADQLPIALWRHFPVDDQKGDALAAAIRNYQKTWHFDFVKVTPSSVYCVADWGVESSWLGNKFGTRTKLNRVIQKPEDWLKLPVLNPNHGALEEQIKCLELLGKEYSPYTPFLSTIFTPLSQAKFLAGEETLLLHLRKYPDQLFHGLKTITQSTQNFVEKALTTKISGIFLAVQLAQYDKLSEMEYQNFGKLFDLQILELTKDLWLNIAHLHGNNIHFDLFTDYPVQVLNWHDQETKPSLENALKRFSGAVCGGLRQEETLVLGSPSEVRREAVIAMQQTNSKRFILGTGCVTPITAPYGNILSAINTVRRMER